MVFDSLHATPRPDAGHDTHEQGESHPANNPWVEAAAYRVPGAGKQSPTAGPDLKFSADELERAAGQPEGITQFLANRNIDPKAADFDDLLRSKFKEQQINMFNAKHDSEALSADATPQQIARVLADATAAELKKHGLVPDNATPAQIEASVAKGLGYSGNPKDLFDFENPVNNYVKAQDTFVQNIHQFLKQEDTTQRNFTANDLLGVTASHGSVGKFFAERGIHPERAGFEDILSEKYRQSEMSELNFLLNKDTDPAKVPSLAELAQAHGEFITQTLVKENLIRPDASNEQKNAAWAKRMNVQAEDSYDFNNPIRYIAHVQDEWVSHIMAEAKH